jgi:eukaryotic-like serine/threonine-protein kinase
MAKTGGSETLETQGGAPPASYSRPSTGLTEPRALGAIAPGASLLGRFEVGVRLGSGGMGVVYRAIDRQLGVPVAVKFLHHFGPRALYRLKREFQVMNVLPPHPNLITPSGLFCEHGVWFVSMELVHGEPFLRYVRPRRELDVLRLRSALAQLALGLSAIHRAGVVHRDLKPSNVLITEQGRLVILDFGLVADVELDPQADTNHGLSGTPRYMAPEQSRGELATAASDGYALGVMLYEALTGTPPFEGATLDPLLAKQAREPLSPARFAPGSPADLVELCLQLLSRDPARRPTAEHVIARLGAAGGPAPAPAPVRTALIGRDDELALLCSALRRTDLGSPQLVLIEGESGIGKTTLVDAFVELRRQGMVALTSRCHPRADVPYKACDGLIDALSRFLGRATSEDAQRWAPQDLDALTQMFPVLGRVTALQGAARRRSAPSDAQELRLRGAAALRELLGRIATEQPVLVFIDDLQWGDADSAPLLRELLRSPGAPPLLFIGAYRSEARDSSDFVRAIRGLADEAGFELQKLALGALGEQDSRELALRLLGDNPDQALAAGIARESSGLPLFVGELSAQARQGILGDGAQAGALAAAIVRRVATLPQPARTVLDLISVAHAPLPESVILEAAQLGADAPTAVRVLSAQALLRMTSDGRLDAYHDRVRESVAAEIAPDRKRALHAALAAALEHSERGHADWLAAHALSAGLTELGLRALLEAAEDAMSKLAFDRAATRYRAALDLLDPADERRRELLVRIGDAHRLDGRGLAAGDAYAGAAELAQGLDRNDLLVRASEMYLCSAYVDRGIDVVLPVLSRMRLSLPRQRWRTQLLTAWEFLASRFWQRRFRARDEATVGRAELARIDACYTLAIGLLCMDDNTGRTVLFLLRGLNFAMRAGAELRAAFVHCVVAASPRGVDSYERTSRPAFESHLALAKRAGNAELEAWVHTCAAMSGLYALRPVDAIARARLAQQVCEVNGIFAGFTVVSAQSALRVGLMLVGRLNELGQVAPEHLRSARARSDLFASTAARAYAALATVAADQPERALDELSETLGMWPKSEHWPRWRERSGLWPNGTHALLIQSWALLYQRRGGAAHAALISHWRDLTMMMTIPCWRLVLLWTRGAAALDMATTTATAASMPARATARSEAVRDARWCLRRVLRIRNQPVVLPFAATLRAGLAALDGDLAGARAQLAAAGDGFEAAGMELFAASARRRLGELTEGEAGVRLLRAADEHMRALGVAVPERWVAVYAPGFE